MQCVFRFVMDSNKNYAKKILASMLLKIQLLEI